MIVVAKVEALLSTHGGQADALRWLRQSSHITTMLDINERAEYSMEQQYQLRHGLSRSLKRRTHGFPRRLHAVAERCHTLGHTQQFSNAASLQVSQANSAYFESIDTQPLQVVRASD